MRNRLVLMMWTAGRSADAEPMSHTRRQSADLLVPEDQWRSMAACRSADPDLFFPISSAGQSMAQEAEAKAICAGCRVRRECLAFALRTHQAHGVWGGLSEQERHSVRSAALAGVKRGQAAQVDAVHPPGSAR
jgi:WhiB family redox-sensing transcriptional regulator